MNRLALILLTVGAAGCGPAQMPLINGKPLLSYAQVDTSSFIATGQSEYASQVCLKNAAVRYCLHHFNQGAILTMLSPPDGNTGEAFFTCSGPTSNSDLTDLSTIPC